MMQAPLCLQADYTEFRENVGAIPEISRIFSRLGRCLYEFPIPPTGPSGDLSAETN
jgi:hypothetical protein